MFIHIRHAEHATELSNRPMHACVCQASFVIALLVIINSWGHFRCSSQSIH